MRTLILATVSAIALGIAGAAPSYAQNTATPTPGSTITQPATPPGATATPPAANSGATLGAAAAQPATPSLGSSSQYSKPYMANASAPGMTAGRVTRGEVRQVQEKLRGDGLYHGRIDGLMELKPARRCAAISIRTACRRPPGSIRIR